MQHNVTITKEENRVIEEYWLIKAYRKSYPQTDGLIASKVTEDEPTYQEIAQYLSKTNAKSACVEHNYRFADLPFC